MAGGRETRDRWDWHMVPVDLLLLTPPPFTDSLIWLGRTGGRCGRVLGIRQHLSLFSGSTYQSLRAKARRIWAKNNLFPREAGLKASEAALMLRLLATGSPAGPDLLLIHHKEETGSTTCWTLCSYFYSHFSNSPLRGSSVLTSMKMWRFQIWPNLSILELYGQM